MDKQKTFLSYFAPQMNGSVPVIFLPPPANDPTKLIIAPAFQQVADALTVGLALANLDGTLVYLNPAFQKLISGNEMQEELTLYDLFTDLDEADHLMTMVYEIGEQGTWQGVLTYHQTSGPTVKLFLAVDLLYNSAAQPQALGLLFQPA
jgi:PAS domain-containing protein